MIYQDRKPPEQCRSYSWPDPCLPGTLWLSIMNQKPITLLILVIAVVAAAAAGKVVRRAELVFPVGAHDGGAGSAGDAKPRSSSLVPGPPLSAGMICASRLVGMK